MNYAEHYERLVERALGRNLSGYFEKHHVVPKCLGGSNDKSNLVRLTAREHFTAHMLLVRMHPKNPKLVFAAHAMQMQGRAGHSPASISKNRQFEWLRKRNAEAIAERRRGKRHSQATKDKISAIHKGRKQTPEARKKISDAHKGVPKTPEHNAKVSAALMGKIGTRLGVTTPEDTKAKQSASAFARTDKAENTRKMHKALAQRTSEERRSDASGAWETRRQNGTDKFSDQQRANMSAAQQAREETPEAARARGLKAHETRRENGTDTYSEESRERMRQAQLGKKQSSETVAKRLATRARNKALREEAANADEVTETA